MKALFIPTAAQDADAIAVLPKCMNDLLNLSIPSENVSVFDLHRALPYDEMCAFDLVYVAGGSPHDLLQRITDSGFAAPLTRFTEDRGVYPGVSAGSLGFIHCTISVHLQIGTRNGTIDTAANPHINRSSNNAILIRGNTAYVIE